MRPKYRTIRLSNFWRDTRIENVFIKEGILSKLSHKYIYSIPLDIIDQQEQGGFLLGSYKEGPGKLFDIQIEQLIDIIPEQQSISNIEFGQQSWQMLDVALNTHPDLNLIGWFHTHPGHGVFLSEQDINVSYTYFNKPYQIALLLDNLISKKNKELEMGIFSFKKNGEINNC